MRKVIYKVFIILIFLVLIGKVANWFLNFGDETNQVLNWTMFTLIGIAYLVMGYIWENKFLKIVIVLCGLFLIAMNFFGNNATTDIIGIICILTPMLIARFYKEKKGKMNVTES